jgi:MFS family permease
VADLTPSGRHGTAFGYYNAALGLGTLAASVLFGFVYERVSPSAAFTMGALLAVAATGLLAITPTAPNPKLRTPNPEPRTPNPEP